MKPTMNTNDSRGAILECILISIIKYSKTMGSVHLSGAQLASFEN